MKKLLGYQKGVNLGGWLSQGSLEKIHLDTFITEKDIEAIASMGCDHVRLPVDYENIENADGSVKESGYDYIKRCIGWCRKNSLNLVLDLHKTCGYTFDNQKESASFWSDNAAQDRFIALWKNIMSHFSGDSDIVMFEPLNEVVGDVSEEWNRLVLRCIKTIRSYSETAKILVGGTNWNAPSCAGLLPDFTDENIVLNFHCYEPHIFTHQSASWVDYIPNDFKIRYPDDYEKYLNLTREMTGDPDHCMYCFDPDVKKFGKEYFMGVFRPAAEKAEKCRLSLYCGEYGVIELARPEDTLAWFKDIHKAFEEMGIGRAVWSYKKMGFGIVDEHYSSIFSELIKQL